MANDRHFVSKGPFDETLFHREIEVPFSHSSFAQAAGKIIASGQYVGAPGLLSTNRVFEANCAGTEAIPCQLQEMLGLIGTNSGMAITPELMQGVGLEGLSWIWLYKQDIRDFIFLGYKYAVGAGVLSLDSAFGTVFLRRKVGGASAFGESMGSNGKYRDEPSFGKSELVSPSFISCAGCVDGRVVAASYTAKTGLLAQFGATTLAPDFELDGEIPKTEENLIERGVSVPVDIGKDWQFVDRLPFMVSPGMAACADTENRDLRMLVFRYAKGLFGHQDIFAKLFDDGIFRTVYRAKVTDKRAQICRIEADAKGDSNSVPVFSLPLRLGDYSASSKTPE